MKILVSVSICVGSLTFSVHAAPSLRPINPVLNAASYTPNIAQGSIFVVIGSELSGINTVLATSFPLQSIMNGTTVRFTPLTGAPAVDALMIYTTRNQVAALLPSGAPFGDYNVAVRYGGNATSPARVSVIQRNPGIFTANSAGFGPAQALNRGELELNRYASATLGQYATKPAYPGMRIDLYGTGLGPDSQSDRFGDSGGNLPGLSASLIVGTKSVPVAYAGRSRGTAGLDQVVAVIPDDAPRGCSVPAQVRLSNGQRSNVFTLSIAEPGDQACSHPILQTAQLARLSSGGTLAIGILHLSRQLGLDALERGVLVDSINDISGGRFARYGLSDISELPGPYAAEGSCTTFRRTGRGKDLLFGPTTLASLDAGPVLLLNGPNVTNLRIQRSQSRTYSGTLSRGNVIPGGAPKTSIGPYTLTGVGGLDVGPFDATTSSIPPLEWLNRNAIRTIDRTAPLTVNWQVSGPATVSVYGISGQQVGGSGDDPVIDGVGFFCSETATAGSITIPTEVLGQLPASNVGLVGIMIYTGRSLGRFNAPLFGGNLDFGQVILSSAATKYAVYR